MPEEQQIAVVDSQGKHLDAMTETQAFELIEAEKWPEGQYLACLYVLPLTPGNEMVMDRIATGSEEQPWVFEAGLSAYVRPGWTFESEAQRILREEYGMEDEPRFAVQAIEGPYFIQAFVAECSIKELEGDSFTGCHIFNYVELEYLKQRLPFMFSDRYDALVEQMVASLPRQHMDDPFLNAKQLADKHPANYKFISDELREDIEPGDVVKICTPQDAFWVEVENADGEQLSGRIGNPVTFVYNGTEDGNLISFKRRNVFELYDDDE